MPKKISRESRVSRTKDQVSCDLAGEAAILHLKNGMYYGLDPVGKFIWDRLEHATTVSQIHAALVEAYDADAARSEEDLIQLLGELLDADLVRVEP